MTKPEKNNLTKIDSFNSIVTDCLGCKWTILLMENIAQGINRPGKLTKLDPRLTTKVLNQCLVRMINYKILTKKSFAQTPPRVEYYLTPFGLELRKLLLEIQLLQTKYFSE